MKWMANGIVESSVLFGFDKSFTFQVKEKVVGFNAAQLNFKFIPQGVQILYVFDCYNVQTHVFNNPVAMTAFLETVITDAVNVSDIDKQLFVNDVVEKAFKNI